MMEKTNYRRNFLKNLSLGIGSFVMFSGFKLKKEAKVENYPFTGISQGEADEIIKGGKFPGNISIRPEPAPKGSKNI